MSDRDALRDLLDQAKADGVIEGYEEALVTDTYEAVNFRCSICKQENRYGRNAFEDRTVPWGDDDDAHADCVVLHAVANEPSSLSDDELENFQSALEKVTTHVRTLRAQRKAGR